MRSDRRLIRAGTLWLLLVGLCLGVGPALAQTYLTVEDQIQAHYLAYYGRSADPAGLAYWKGRFAAPGADIQQVATALGTSPEFDAIYGGMSNSAIITAIYQQLLGRAPDAGGASFYAGLLASGQATLQTVARRILDGAQGDDRMTIANRIAVSSYYTEQVRNSGGAFDTAANRGILAGVTNQETTIADAADAIDSRFGLALTVLHVNDVHSHVDPNTSASLLFDGVATTVETGGLPRVVAAMTDLEAGETNVLKLHAGDAITGTIYYSSFKGEVDAELMNLICFDAFAVGNHEFDDGDDGLAQFLGFLAADPQTCNTPVLGANVVPAVGTPLLPAADQPLLQPYVIREFGGEQIAIIGIEVAQKTKVSSSPLETTQFLDEAETAQHYIDLLTSQGIDKVILLTHNGFERDLDMIPTLRGVDVVIDGDSHTLLGDTFADFGLNPVDAYPTQVSDADGNPVCVAQAWQYADVVGEMNVLFDAQGRVKRCGGTPHLLLGDTFKRGGAELAGDERQAILDVIAATPELTIVTPDPAAEQVADVYRDQVEALKTTLIGVSSNDLCLTRVPGEKRSAICDQRATQANGGDIQQLVSYAYLQRSFRADIAVQNAGGVRIDIPAGDVTIATAFTLLPFANTLVEFDMTGAEVRQVLEEAVDNVVANNSTGAYPYGANVRWQMDLSQPKGSRLSNVEIRRKSTAAWVALQDNDQLVVVTNSFLANGGDGYFTFKTVRNDGRYVDTYIDYAQGFIDYIQQDLGGALPGDPYLTVPPTFGPIPCDDYSTQLFTDKTGATVLPDPAFPRACEAAAP